jgi:hypothetical protein
MVKCGVLFEVRTEFLNTIQTSLSFKVLIMQRQIASKERDSVERGRRDALCANGLDRNKTLQQYSFFQPASERHLTVQFCEAISLLQSQWSTHCLLQEGTVNCHCSSLVYQ